MYVHVHMCHDVACVCVCKYGNMGQAQQTLERRQKRVKTGHKEVRG